MATVLLSPFADVGPNQWTNFGSGASQAARLADESDSSFLRATLADKASRFSINPAQLPADLGLTTRIDLYLRERIILAQADAPAAYRIYVNGILWQEVLEDITVLPVFTDTWKPVLLDNNILAADAPTLQVEIYTQPSWVPLERWDMSRMRIELTYNPVPVGGMEICVGGDFGKTSSPRGSVGAASVGGQFSAVRPMNGVFDRGRVLAGSIRECDD